MCNARCLVKSSVSDNVTSNISATTNSDQMESDPLLSQLERVRDYLSNYSETVGDFYSPMESPLGKLGSKVLYVAYS